MLNFLFKKTSCSHDKINPNIQAGYCPDCGEYIENHWYITRCSCCGIKQQTTIVNEKITPNNKYCRNCGSCSFFIEKLESINIVDINYAVIVKKSIENKKHDFIQTWVDKEFTSLKLLSSH